MTSWRASWIFFENESSIKSLRTSICTYISNFVKIRPFLTNSEFWPKTRFTYDVITAILKILGLLTGGSSRKLNLMVKPHVSNACGSGGVVVTIFRGKKPNGRFGGHIGFSINVKTTYYEYAHQEEIKNFYKIDNRKY